MRLVTSGTQYIQERADVALPMEPEEPQDAWESRINLSVLTPYTTSLITRAVDAILRRPIELDGDEYWKDFAKSVDGIGSSCLLYTSPSPRDS